MAPATKEKIFHPSSRRAGQLARHAHRKSRLENLASKRSQKYNSLVDVYGFFYHAIPEEGVLTLEELHQIIREVWLTRFDQELEQEKATRRKGRPKSAKEIKLEELKLRAVEEYRTGMEVPDLTHALTVELFRRWDQKELAFTELLRFIRIFSFQPDTIVVSKPGKHFSITGSNKSMPPDEDDTMSVETDPQ
ncbi:hypothetical protein L208DRAFT_1343090 [Tricholoma matsutake]|nr:hypothetical protein L208DRAFT_1343090 [Tricholoma matsutake 945]